MGRPSSNDPADPRVTLEAEVKRLRAELDASERERARLTAIEERLRDAARDAERRKDQFLAMLGHELRNPLAPIQTALDLMEMRAPDTFVRERRVIGRQLGHMVRLVDDLLDVSRITRGTLELHRATVELGQAVADAVELVSPLLELRRHELHLSVSDGLWVDGDRHRLGQVVANLLTNAARYTEPGGHLEIEAERAGAQVVVRVRDDGAGLDPAIAATMFEPFTQGPQTPDRSRGGLGLGLALVHSLVALHGGSVRATSDGPGQGSEFEVRLPAATPVEGRLPQRAARPTSARQRRILVVDDNLDLAETLAEALEMLGHLPRIAHDGPQALAIADRFEPHIALVDIGLPVMDGHELARRLRALARPPARLIAVTGYGTADDRHAALAAGFDAHVAKPLDLARLADILTAADG
jgi:signal transduction histidine kinase